MTPLVTRGRENLFTHIHILRQMPLSLSLFVTHQEPRWLFLLDKKGVVGNRRCWCEYRPFTTCRNTWSTTKTSRKTVRSNGRISRNKPCYMKTSITPVQSKTKSPRPRKSTQPRRSITWTWETDIEETNKLLRQTRASEGRLYDGHHSSTRRLFTTKKLTGLSGLPS